MSSRRQPSREELQQQIERFLAGNLSHEELGGLDRLLREDQSARELFYRCVDLDIGLRELMPGPDDACPATLRNTTVRLKSSPTGWLVALSSASLALAVASLLVLYFSLRSPRLPQSFLSDSPSQPAALSDRKDSGAATVGTVALVETAGVEFFGESLIQIGNTLKLNKEYAITAGMLELRFPNGAAAIIEAPSVFEIEKQDRLIVRQGKCSVHAPHGAEGFQVITPKTEVIDLGTRFSVSVDEIGNTDVYVSEGLAEIRSVIEPDAEAIRLSAEEAQRFAGSPAEPSTKLSYKPNHYTANLPDRVLGYSAVKNENGLASELTQVQVQRGGKQFNYHPQDMVSIEVLHFRAERNNHNALAPMEEDGDRLRLLESDALLNSGLINFGGSKNPLIASPVIDGTAGLETTLGLAVRFRQPIVNCEGPDVLLMEVQAKLHPVAGDAFHVSPITFGPGLHSHTITKFDITLDSPIAHPVDDFRVIRFHNPATTLEDLGGPIFRTESFSYRFWVLAVGIDLSDLGYPPGHSVDALFLQDAKDDAHEIDPVFIAGLPPVVRIQTPD